MSKAHNALESVTVPVPFFSHTHVNVMREITHKIYKEGKIGRSQDILSLFCCSD